MFLNEEQKQEVLSKINIINSLCESIRLIDPLRNEVLDFEGNPVEPEDQPMLCHSVWPGGGACENCISMRAFSENRIFMRLEHAGDNLFLVIAVPVELNGKKVVAEMLKDVTGTMIMNDEVLSCRLELARMLDRASQQAVKDDLTGLYNRRYIMEKLPLEMIAAKLNDERISVIMADLDSFKKVNDQYGHLAGDEVLRQVAAILEKNIRKSKDWATRYGGEEFLIFLKNIESVTAVAIAERIRKEVESTTFLYEGNPIRMTISLGVCSMEKGRVLDVEELVACCDKNLYEAKRKGRNRVIGPEEGVRD